MPKRAMASRSMASEVDAKRAMPSERCQARSMPKRAMASRSMASEVDAKRAMPSERCQASDAKRGRCQRTSMPTHVDANARRSATHVDQQRTSISNANLKWISLSTLKWISRSTYPIQSGHLGPVMRNAWVLPRSNLAPKPPRGRVC